MQRSLVILTLTAAALCGSAANAASLSGFGNPAANAALAGGTQIDFSSFANGSYASVNQNGATISGTGGQFRISDDFGNLFNSTGRHLDNNQGSTLALEFLFADAVSAFAFNLGAHDSSWTLKSYAGANLLETYTFAPTFASNAGQYYGLSGSGITRATLEVSSFDYVLLDNLTFALDEAGAVPEPATWAMMLVGFGMVGGAMRRRAKISVGYA
jgi:PEP-CTERM motif